MDFGSTFYGKQKFIAKIKKENIISIKMFEKIGYIFQKEV